MNKGVVIFLKGMLMGICDIIPGISGGTIAFITGIYDRLINAVKNISPKLVVDFFRYIFKRDEGVKEDIRKVDIPFLVILGAGIGVAVLAGARAVSFLLENYFAYTISFFVGLILASSKAIFDRIEKHHGANMIFGFIGLLIGILLSLIIPLEINPTFGYVFLGGFLAISAMFLPGISGAFILLILGLYEFMLGVLHDILENISFFIVFVVGAGLGAFTISRVVSFLFRKDRCKTLYVLLGLVVGSLSIPIRNVYADPGNIFIMLLLLLLGFLAAWSINKVMRI